jgi:hypothetical protein
MLLPKLSPSPLLPQDSMVFLLFHPKAQLSHNIESASCLNATWLSSATAVPSWPPPLLLPHVIGLHRHEEDSIATTL